MSRLAGIVRDPWFAAVRAAIVANYYLQRYRDVTWIIGDGRSGTTWVSELVNWDKKYREMFEPFHPLVRQMRNFRLHQYIPAEASASDLDDQIASVFSGRLGNQRVDMCNSGLLFSGLLIKDIFANLIAPYVQRRFPKVKIILLIRNPFAVALSKQKKPDWIWLRNPAELLQQEQLYQDHLKPFEVLIRGVSDDFIVRQVLIWAIIHYLPLKLLERRNVHIVFYENLHANPGVELPLLLEFTRGSSSEKDAIFGQFKVPSRVTGKTGNIMLGKSPITAWQNEISRAQVVKGIEVLEHFGLEKLYGMEPFPAPREVDEVRASNIRCSWQQKMT